MHKYALLIIAILLLGISDPPTQPQQPAEPEWDAIQWGECSATCGQGTQTGTTQCVLEEEEVDESWCEEEKPQLQRTCEMHACDQATLTIESEVETNITITYQNTTKKNYSTPTTLQQNTPIQATINLTNLTNTWFSHWRGCEDPNNDTCTVNVSINNHTTITAIQRIYECETNTPRGEGVLLGKNNSTKQYQWEYTNTNPGVCEWTCRAGYVRDKNSCKQSQTSSGGGGSSYGISSNPILERQSDDIPEETIPQESTENTQTSTNNNQETQEETPAENTKEETKTSTNSNQEDALTENQQAPREEQPTQATNTTNPWILLTAIIALLAISTTGIVIYKKQQEPSITPETPAQQYVRINTEKGFSKEQIQQKLLAAGYTKQQVRKLFEK